MLGARLLTEAYRELFDYRLPTSRADAFQRIESDREALSEPLAVLFDRGDPDGSRGVFRYRRQI